MSIVNFFREFDTHFINGIHKSLAFSYKIGKKLGFGPKIVFDDTLGDKNIPLLLKHLKNYQWQQINEILQEANDICRSFYIGYIADEDTTAKFRPDYFNAWVKAEPNNPFAHLTNGFNLINWGWEARGSGVSSTVSSGMAEQFFLRLLAAQQSFERVMQLDDSNPEPYIGMITIEMGISYEQESLWENFVQLKKRSLNHYNGHSAMLISLAEKWGGSSQAMFSLARNTSKQVPPGSPLHALIVEAHIEEWLHYSMIDDEETQQNYFFQKEVIQEIIESYNLCFPNNDPGVDPDTIEILNNYAFCLFQGKVEDGASELLTKLGRRGTSSPWCYMDEPFYNFLDSSYAYSYAFEKLGLIIPK